MTRAIHRVRHRYARDLRRRVLLVVDKDMYVEQSRAKLCNAPPDEVFDATGFVVRGKDF